MVKPRELLWIGLAVLWLVFFGLFLIGGQTHEIALIFQPGWLRAMVATGTVAIAIGVLDSDR